MTMLVAALAACGEVVSSPGYVLNGGFAGAWVRDDPDRSSDMPARIELAIADRVDLLTSADPHTGEMSFEPRLLARGVLTLDAESHPFRLDWRTQPGFWVSYGANDDERGFSIWLDSYRVTRQASRRRPQRDVLFVRFGEGRADTYRRE